MVLYEVEYIRSRRRAVAEIRSQLEAAMQQSNRSAQAGSGKGHVGATVAVEVKMQAPTDRASEVGDDSSGSSSGVSSASIGAEQEISGFELGTVGLALSGGGIRSASFNLGVLQALAQQKLLSNLDYLSTVSGGGYIGSWLSAWINRDGCTLNVERLIVPERQVNALAERHAISQPILPHQIFDAEVEPIRHLRENTNFLAPQPGMLSLDSWTLLAIYLRNVLLNACVVVPTLIALQLAAMVLSNLYELAEHTNTNVFLVFGLAFLAPMFYILAITFSQSRRKISDHKIKYSNLDLESSFFSRSFVLPIGLLVAGCYCFALHVNSESYGIAKLFNTVRSWVGWTPLEFSPQRWNWNYVLVFSTIAGLLHTLPNVQSYRWLLSRESDRKSRLESLQWIFAGFAAGSLLGLLSLGSFLALYSDQVSGLKLLSDSTENSQLLLSLRLTLIVPMLLWSYFIAESLQVGILGRLEFGELREKWSFFHSFSFIASMAWLMLFGHVCVLPQLILAALDNWYTMLGPGSLWLMTSGISLWLAHSERSGSTKRPYIDVLVKIGPPVVLSGVCLLIAICAHRLMSGSSLVGLALAAMGSLALAVFASLFVDVNIFSLQELYQNRLVRAFLGASRPKRGQVGAPFRAQGNTRSPDPITRVDSGDDLELHYLAGPGSSADAEQPKLHSGQPLLLINAAINLQGENELERQERQADSFTLTPLHCGCPRTGYRSTREGYAGKVTLGTAFAISGAAVSPNMGYYSSPAVTALLTLFNLRLGAWMPNPSGEFWKLPGPMLGWIQLLNEMLGRTTSRSTFIYLSDGGHFDNLGVYELLRRRCRYIVASDAGADPTGSCHELGMIVRKAFIDFGIKVEIDLSQLSTDPGTGYSQSRVAVGKVYYPPRSIDRAEDVGYLIYIKSTMDGSEPADIQSFKRRNPQFPHQSTIDQFFSESQFESYRKLGYTIADAFLTRDQTEFKAGHPMRRPALPRKSLDVQRYFEYIMAVESMAPSQLANERELSFNQSHVRLESELHVNPRLAKLRVEIACLTKVLDSRESELFRESSKSRRRTAVNPESESLEFMDASAVDRTDDERGAESAWALQTIQLLDDVKNHFQLDDYHNSLSRGWMRVARRWMLNSAFRRVWPCVQGDYSCQLSNFVSDLQSDVTWIPRAVDRAHCESKPDGWASIRQPFPQHRQTTDSTIREPPKQSTRE